jgi:spermidine synthase
MTESFAEYDHLILQEMLVHPALFTHAKAAKIAIIGHNNDGILQETLKHPHLQEIWQIVPTQPQLAPNDPRLHYFVGSNLNWLSQIASDSFDIIIVADESADASPSVYQLYLKALHADGILIQAGDSLFNMNHLKARLSLMEKVGFKDKQVLHFPQPNYPSGSRTATMGIKLGSFKRVREKDIFNKSFITRYYNFDVHKASSVMPEFMREELAV